MFPALRPPMVAVGIAGAPDVRGACLSKDTVAAAILQAKMLTTPWGHTPCRQRENGNTWDSILKRGKGEGDSAYHYMSTRLRSKASKCGRHGLCFCRW